MKHILIIFSLLTLLSSPLMAVEFIEEYGVVSVEMIYSSGHYIESVDKIKVFQTLDEALDYCKNWSVEPRIYKLIPVEVVREQYEEIVVNVRWGVKEE